MAYNPQRKRRYNKLLKQGFTRYEARHISSIKEYPPYVQQMINIRQAQRKRAIDEGWPKSKWNRYIRDSYVTLGHFKKDTLNRRRIDVWKLIRANEDAYKDSHKDYDTPTKKGSYPLSDFNEGALNDRPGG